MDLASGACLAVAEKTDSVGRARWANTLLLVGLLVIAGIVIPTSPLAPLDDDWDFLLDFVSHPFDVAVLLPTNGHFRPLHKLIYGALLIPFGYNYLVLVLVQAGIRMATVLLAYKLTNRRFPETVLLLLCLCLNDVGVRSTFRWPFEISLELVLFLILATVHAVRAFFCGKTQYVWVAGTLMFVATLTKAHGLLAALSLPVAFSLVHSIRGQKTPAAGRVLWMLSALAIVTWTLGSVRPEGMGSQAQEATWWLHSGLQPNWPTRLGEMFRYFLYLTLANSGVSGLRVMSLPGILNAAFALVLLSGCLLTARYCLRMERAFAIVFLLLCNLTANAATAWTRWSYGVPHAGSYRYVYLNLFFQLLLAIIVFDELRERLASHSWSTACRGVAVALTVPVFLLAASGAASGLAIAKANELDHYRCIEELAAHDDDRASCSGLGLQTSATVRRVWLLVRPRGTKAN